MKPPVKRPLVKLSGTDGNAFAIIGSVKKAMKENGADKEYISRYFDEATSGDYNNVFAVSMRYVDIE